jgi:hypothetical protein
MQQQGKDIIPSFGIFAFDIFRFMDIEGRMPGIAT